MIPLCIFPFRNSIPFFSHSGGQKFKIKVQVVLVSGGNSLPGLQMAAVSLCLDTAFLLCISSYEDPCPIGSGFPGGTAAAAATSLQSCPTLCDPIDGSPPGSPSLGFSRQEHWSGLPFPSPMHESEK